MIAYETPKTVTTEKRSRYTWIYIEYKQVDTFGKEERRKVLFCNCLDYELKESLKQAENIKNAY